MSRRPPIAMLSLASIAVAGVSPPWRPATVRDLHSEYGNIFKHGNRNAASHLWVSFILQRASQLAPSKLEEMFTGFCAVSGSPTRPSDYTRYRLTLPRVDGGGLVSGFMYYCCWPCVCDTQDFIRVDTANVTLAGGEVRRYYWAVVGNPCDDPPKLREPFVQPFYGRGETSGHPVRRGAAPSSSLLGALLLRRDDARARGGRGAVRCGRQVDRRFPLRPRHEMNRDGPRWTEIGRDEPRLVEMNRDWPR
uniref:Uncharacterized protein n=1 Tax=Emiliania huxleyi TaxID=2903 RepID=A0A7S3T470_EMIHU